MHLLKALPIKFKDSIPNDDEDKNIHDDLGS
jgi:hypothetical protein